MLDFLRDPDAEVAAMLEKVLAASATFVKQSGRPPRDIIGIPNVERLVQALRAPEMVLELFTQVSQMAVFEATLFHHEPLRGRAGGGRAAAAGLWPEGAGPRA